jgi:hypothetical protein
MLDIIGVMLGAVLTLMTLSYLLGDNFFYRLGLHLFIGMLVGYSLGVVIRDVFVDMLWTELTTNPAAVMAPVVLGALLIIFKGLPRQAYIGNFSVAYLVGVGAAVALSGALLGTLIPQVEATGRALSPTAVTSYRMGSLDGILVVVGTICTLMAFNFTAHQQRGSTGMWTRIVKTLGWLGRGFLLFAFGVAFAGALTASLSIFVGRVQYLIDAFFLIAGGW